MSYKVLFCGTPDFAKRQLEFLLNDQEYKVVTVVSQPDRPSGRGQKLKPSPVKELALKNNISVLTPEKASDGAFIEELKRQTYDVCVVVAYGQILKRKFLDLFPNTCVNLHASLLPRWRGAAPIQRAIMAGDLETGIGLQVVVPKLDAGAVIGERRTKIRIADDALVVHDALAELGGELLCEDLKNYLKGDVKAVLQDEALVTYAQKITKAESEIDWTMGALEIHNKIRGLALGPHANTMFQGQRLKILKSMPVDQKSLPGVVAEATPERLLIGCSKGCLQVLILQPESKKPMSASEFLRGHPLKVGGFFASH